MEGRLGKGQQQAKPLSVVSSQGVPYAAIGKAGGESVVGLKRDTEGWLGVPGQEWDLICHLEETVLLVGDSNCLGQM